jgi:hypothetical protein
LRIILLCTLAAILYGILNDQVTARVCVEYFTVGHAPIFNTTSPTLLAFGWGTLATWWVGMLLGIIAAVLCRAGSWPKLDAACLVRPILCLLVIMAVASLLAGVTGYQLAMASGLRLPEPYGARVPKAHHAFFFADSLAHLAAYSIGSLGGMILCARLLIQRRRAARAARNRITHTEMPPKRWIAVLGRWTAAAIGIPLFCLLVVLAFGDGVPNPLTASLQENVLGIVVLTTLAGLLLAWKREGVGGLLILAGLLLFAIADNRSLLGIVVAPWLVTGALCLLCWWNRRNAAGA